MQANAAAADSAKRLKQAETGNADLQRRVDDLDRELQTANSDNRRLQEEIAQLKKSNDDLQSKLDALTRENNKLSGTESECTADQIRYDTKTFRPNVRSTTDE